MWGICKHLKTYQVQTMRLIQCRHLSPVRVHPQHRAKVPILSPPAAVLCSSANCIQYSPACRRCETSRVMCGSHGWFALWRWTLDPNVAKLVLGASALFEPRNATCEHSAALRAVSVSGLISCSRRGIDSYTIDQVFILLIWKHYLHWTARALKMPTLHSS